MLNNFLRTMCLKPVFQTRIQQRDWLAKKFAASSTNHVAVFLFSLRVARTNSPSGKRALVPKIIRITQNSSRKQLRKIQSSTIGPLAGNEPTPLQ